MKKFLSLFLVTTMSFSWGSAASAADTAKSNLNAANVSTWQNKKVLDLTASEVLSFLSAMKGKTETVEVNEEVQESRLSRMLSSLGGSFFANVFPYISLYVFMIALQKGTSWYNNFMARKNCGNIDGLKEPTKALELFDLYLSAIKGQTKAKEEMRKIVLNIVDENKKRNTFGKESSPKGARVIYMVGPSGVGKSYSAEILTKVLTGLNSKPYIIEASDIDKQSKSSPIDQIFGMRAKKVSNSEVYECSPLITQIKSTPEMVVLINEYDKMHTPEFDEKFRTMMDHGYIMVNGEKIDCSKTIFIITSNESSVCVNRGNQTVDFASIDDGTGSRTFIKHDKAFLNRVKLVEFENLDKKAYEEIADIPFKALKDRYKLEYGIDLDLKNTIEKVSEKVEELNKGARPIYDFVDALNEKILSDVVLKGLAGEQYKNKKYEVSYSHSTNSFNLKEVLS